MTEYDGLRSDDGDEEATVLVRRSVIDSDVWYCLPMNMATDQSDWSAPGRVRAVKQYAEEKYREAGYAARWVREGPDTWRMRLVPKAQWPERG